MKSYIMLKHEKDISEIANIEFGLRNDGIEEEFLDYLEELAEKLEKLAKLNSEER